uniref:Glycosyltransferase n=1 Tax=Glycyrrhiza glabra TaxID=49827 RepID=A0AA94YE77_GLYGL|nr:UDP-glycosyltransferase UGT16 [Glycyrrhiza glabra]
MVYHLHFVLFPFMAQGHMIPMMDFAKTLVLHKNTIVTVVTTPRNATRCEPIVARYIESGFQIRIVPLQFPCKEAGVPDGCESVDMLPSLDMALNFFNATKFLREPVEKLFQELTPPPSCIISDMCLPYTIHVATKFNIPRISFIGVSCFYLTCLHNLRIYDVMERVATKSKYFVLPGIADKIEMTKEQTGILTGEHWEEFHHEMTAAEKATYGVITNSFEELEPTYAGDYKKVRGGRLWCVGPLSLSNKDPFDKVQRGNTNTLSIDESQSLKWLDRQKPRAVIYVCFGSVCNLKSLQLVELGLALEATKRPFIWVIRDGNQLEALEKWLKEDGFEERTKDRGLVIRGWAPQLVILSHPAIGGFMTHSGWNSTLEAICAGVPMVTWPLFADQFFNERLVVEILKIGVKVGVETPQEEDSGVLVKNEDIGKAVEKLMGETSESEERRKRIKELAEMAKSTINEKNTFLKTLIYKWHHPKLLSSTSFCFHSWTKAT